MMDVVRQYSLPLVMALLLHGVAALGLYANWNPTTKERDVIKPRAMQAQLVMLEPAAQAQPQPQPKPQPQPQPQPKPEPKPQPKPEPKPEPKPQPDPEVERKRAEEAERRRAEEAAREQARQQRLEALAQSSFQDALQSEASELAEAQQAAGAAAAQSYRAGIYQAVVANWSRPPSARNRMEAKLLVELVPTGDVASVTVVESSGNAAFDRSAEAAVRKARRFEVPDEPDVFENYFRRFTLLFRPEDLLR
jgi:TonB family protein